MFTLLNMEDVVVFIYIYIVAFLNRLRSHRFFLLISKRFPSKKSFSHLVSVYTIFCYCQSIFFIGSHTQSQENTIVVLLLRHVSFSPTLCSYLNLINWLRPGCIFFSRFSPWSLSYV